MLFSRLRGFKLALRCIIAIASLYGIVVAQTLKCPPATGKDFHGKDLRDHNFRADPPGSLRNANFSDAKLSGAAFDGQDLTGASFQNANLGPSKATVGLTKTVLDRTCFIGADLDKTDFQFAQITCADFSGTSLIQAKFGPLQDIRMGSNCRTKFVGATLDVRLITADFAGKSNWSKSDFTNANFQNVSPSTFSLAGKDITGAILEGTAFIGINMRGANLTNVSFRRANITKAILDNTASNGANFYNANAKSASFICAQFYGTGGGQQKKPDGSTCPKPPVSTDALRSADFRLAALSNADFTSAILDHALLSGASFDRASLPNASLSQAFLQSTTGPDGPIDVAHVQFADFSNANFKDAKLTSVDFSGGVLTGAIFDGKGTSLTRAKFDNATMPNASFQNTTLQAVSLASAILQSARFDGSTMSILPNEFAVNFRCAQLGGASFKDTIITAGNFSSAVMPVSTDCCEGKTGPYCGNIDATQQTYSAVTLPVLDSLVTCPNGDVAKCAGSQWQLSPNWTTSNCSDGGVRIMWSKPNCSGNPGEIVVFKDANLKACILKTLPGQTEVTVQTAAAIPQIVCPFHGIIDITGLEKFTGMTKLDLSGNHLTQFTLRFDPKIKSQLQNLDLSNNQLTTLDTRGHPKLLLLSAAHNKLASVSLNANTFLLVLDVSHNEITSFDLAIQDILAFADLSHNKLTTVLNPINHDLSRLINLSYLDLSQNRLETVGSAASLAWNQSTGTGGALQSLFLSCNPTFDCSTLNLYDGKKYPAAATAMCARYNPAEGKWNPIRNPDCPPGK